MKSNILKFSMTALFIIFVISAIVSIIAEENNTCYIENTNCSSCDKVSLCKNAVSYNKIQRIDHILLVAKCPRGYSDYQCPGQCGNFIDADGSGYCDVAEPKSEPSVTENTSTQEPDKTGTDTTPALGNDNENGNANLPLESISPSDNLLENDATNCPYGVKNDPYPGRCKLYKDENGDDLCDLSVEEAKIGDINSNDDSIWNRTIVSKTVYQSLNLPNSRNYILITILLIASMLGFIKFGNKIRIGLLIISFLLFGYFYKVCTCPFGILADISLMPVLGYVVPLTLVMFFFIPIGFALFFGRIYCSSACPFGAAQELLAKVGSFLKIKPRKPPKWLLKTKYFILPIFIGLTMYFASKWFCKIDPFTVLFNFNGTSIAAFLLGLILVASLVFGRVFCKYICPYGALLGVVSKFSLFKYKICNDCKNCVVCQNVCPMDAVEKGKINHMECIRCGICKEKCPVNKTRKVPVMAKDSMGLGKTKILKT